MKRILIVDDSALTRQVVRAAASSLLGSAVEFLEAGDGAVGYRLATGHALDLVVCDLNMPEMDGYALLARLRGLARHKATPVIILSSLVNNANASQLRAAGANVVLKKPFNHQDLRDGLKRVGLV